MPTERAPTRQLPDASAGRRLHIHGIKEMPAGYDAEVAELFRDFRAASNLSEADLAARLATRLEVVQALEQGALFALPDWAETCRVVNNYGLLLNLDVRPLLRRIYAQVEAGIVELRPKPMPDVPFMMPPETRDGGLRRSASAPPSRPMPQRAPAYQRQEPPPPPRPNTGARPQAPGPYARPAGTAPVHPSRNSRGASSRRSPQPQPRTRQRRGRKPSRPAGGGEKPARKSSPPCEMGDRHASCLGSRRRRMDAARRAQPVRAVHRANRGQRPAGNRSTPTIRAAARPTGCRAPTASKLPPEDHDEHSRRETRQARGPLGDRARHACRGRRPRKLCAPVARVRRARSDRGHHQRAAQDHARVPGARAAHRGPRVRQGDGGARARGACPARAEARGARASAQGFAAAQGQRRRKERDPRSARRHRRRGSGAVRGRPLPHVSALCRPPGWKVEILSIERVRQWRL